MNPMESEADATVTMMEEEEAAGTVLHMSLEQSPSNLLNRMNLPGSMCRKFSVVAWCAKLNAIACATETCASRRSTANPKFWIPIQIVTPERPTECVAFNVTADSPLDSVQFIQWSPVCCPGALLIANYQGRVTIWTQPSHVIDTRSWQCEHKWQQDIAVVTKWLLGASMYRCLSSNSSAPANSKSTFVKKFGSQKSQTSATWPNFLCVCSVFSSGWVQLHWSHWPPSRNKTSAKWFCTSKGVLSCGLRGISTGDAIITESGALHVAGVPTVNPSTVIIWEVMPGRGNALQLTPMTSIHNGVPPLSPPNWSGFAPLAAYLFSSEDHLHYQNLGEFIPLHCSAVSSFSAYVSPEAAEKTPVPTTWCSGIAGVAFDPTRGGSVMAAVVVEGKYMSPNDPDAGPSVTGWRVQQWESSFQPVVLHPIFGSMGGNPPMQTVWQSKVDISIPATNDKSKGVHFNPFDLPTDIRTLARVVYSAHGGEIAVAFLWGGVRIYSGPNFTPVANYQVNVGPAFAVPAFSATSCCSAFVWHDTKKAETVLKIIRLLPPAIPIGQMQANSSTLERAIAERFWWSLFVGVDWWDVVGCTQSADEDGIVSVNSVIAVLDEDFHSLPTAQERQQYCSSLDRIKCRLLEGSNAQDVTAMVLDMQARLLLDMLGKGIEYALKSPSALLPDPWLASGETLSSIDTESMVVQPALIPCIQAYVNSVLDLALHFITRLRRHARFCRTLANQAVTAQNSTTPGTSQGGENETACSSRSAQMNAWVQETMAKISSTSDGVSIEPISINIGTSLGTPAVRLVGDCHFLHRLCKLLLFCLLFRRSQLMLGSRLGSGNGGQGYTYEEVRALFVVLIELCRRTSELQHPLPVSQVGSSNIQVRLHFIEGNYTVLPEVVEASIVPHMQNMPHPKVTDAAGLLLRELELHPPAEEWHQLNMFGGPSTDPNDASNPLDFRSLENNDIDYGTNGLLPRKRRMSERDAAFGLNTSVGLGPYLGLMGSRRDVITTVWKTGLEGVWYKCLRCMRQTSAFTSPGSTNLPNQNDLERWWISSWAYGCPMCGGRWARVI